MGEMSMVNPVTCIFYFCEGLIEDAFEIQFITDTDSMKSHAAKKI